MYSSVVSLKPPFLALVKGVRMARVMTTSSGFFDVLWDRSVNSGSIQRHSKAEEQKAVLRAQRGETREARTSPTGSYLE